MELTIDELNNILQREYERGLKDGIKLPKDINNPYKDFKVIKVPTACTFCPNHPSNGGSGNCNCTLGDIKITC